jgi:hypothetical protein
LADLSDWIRNERIGRMKAPIGLLGAMLLLGCAATKPPEQPQFQTPVGWACGRVCQREHALCTSRCNQVVKGGCVSECNQSLKDCYDFCLADETRTPPQSD